MILPILSLLLSQRLPSRTDKDGNSSSVGGSAIRNSRNNRSQVCCCYQHLCGRQAVRPAECYSSSIIN